jgi:hypothetical protein
MAIAVQAIGVLNERTLACGNERSEQLLKHVCVVVNKSGRLRYDKVTRYKVQEGPRNAG